MHVIALDHVSIHTAKFEDTICFYIRIGLVRAPMPSFPMPEPIVWLCDDSGRDILHVVSDTDDALAAPAPFNHFALDCTDHDACIDRLNAGKIPFETADYPSFGIRQLFVRDPNGIKVELRFRAEPVPPDRGTT